MSQSVTRAELKQELDNLAVNILQNLDKQFVESGNRFDMQDKAINNLTNAVDAYAKQVELYYHESLARDAQVDRLERWVEKIAKETGVKLEL